MHGEKDWKAGRTYGEVLHKDKTGKWVCNFAEKDGANVAWSRSALRFEKRAEAPKQTAPAAEGGGKAAGKESAAPAAPPVDSSDEEVDSDLEALPPARRDRRNRSAHDG